MDDLLRLLKDEDEGMREETARALDRIGDPRAREPLQALLNDRWYPVTQAAREALGRLRNE